MNDEQFESICNAARKSYRHHMGSIRGQIITPQDDEHWHIAQAAWEDAQKEQQEEIARLREYEKAAGILAVEKAELRRENERLQSEAGLKSAVGVTEAMLVAALKEADPLGALVDWDETKDCVTRPQMRRILEADMLAA